MGRRGPKRGEGGRPPLAAAERRSVQVQVRLTKSEAAALDASRGQETRGGLLRRLLEEWLRGR